MQNIVTERTGLFGEMAISVDAIGWRRFMEGMVSEKILEIQKLAVVEERSRLTLLKWGSGLVIKLLEVTHGLWLYRNVQVHDAITGDIVTKRKEEI